MFICRLQGGCLPDRSLRVSDRTALMAALWFAYMVYWSTAMDQSEFQWSAHVSVRCSLPERSAPPNRSEPSSWRYCYPADEPILQAGPSNNFPVGDCLLSS